MNRLFTRIVSAATSAAAAVFLSLGGLNIFTGESGYDAAYSSIVLGVTSGDTKADISDPAVSAGDLDGLTLHTKKIYEDFENADNYQRPSAQNILKDFNAQSGKRSAHPSLMITDKSLTTLKKAVSDPDDPKYSWYGRLQTKADKYCEQLSGNSKNDYLFNYTKCYETRMPGAGNKGTAADDFRDKMMTFGMMYQITGLQKYADAAWVVLNNVNQFPDINPWHDLDFGFFCQGYAIAYDWMYSAWEKQGKLTKLEDAIKRLCFRPANDSYTSNSPSRSQTSSNGVVRGVFAEHNHNPIVTAGVVMVSLALMGKYKDITSSLCHDAFICLEKDLNKFAPDGATTEGMEYMLLSLDNFSMLFSSMETSLGKFYGLDTCTGLKDGRLMRVIHGMESDAGSFSFSDTYDSLMTTAGELYFYRHYDLHYGFSSDILKRLAANSPNDTTRIVQILCWYEEDTSGTKTSIDKDMVISGDAAFATFRSSFEPKQSFVGVKAGTTLRDFFVHLDQGSFVFNALGVKWAIDMGKDSYKLPGYMSPTSEDNIRFKIFRLRADAHNTLLINPNASDFGYEFEKTAKLETSSSETQAKAVVDMTDLVSSKASSAKRGFLLTDNRLSLVVRDEVDLKDTSTLYWVMYTPQKIQTNGNTAILTYTEDESVQLKIDFTSSAEGSLYSESAARWWHAPVVEDQSTNDSYKRLVYRIKDVKGPVNITAKLTPLTDATKSAPDVSSYGAIDSWSTNPTKLNDKPQSEFIKQGDVSNDAVVELNLGDVDFNGFIDAVDSSQVHAYYSQVSAGKEGSFNVLQKAVADVNKDGYIDAVDASQILAYYAYASNEPGTLTPIEKFKLK